MSAKVRADPDDVHIVIDALRMNLDHKALEASDKMRLALKADVHLQTVYRYLAGHPMQARTRRRIDEAARKLGFSNLLAGSAPQSSP